MALPRVLLADDHTIVADGLRSLLAEHFDLVGTVRDGVALVEAAAVAMLVPSAPTARTFSPNG